MNEQIKQLLAQSGLQPYYDAQEGQIEKFAKLIVKECIGIVEENRLDEYSQAENPTDFVEGWEGNSDVIIEDLMNHFGVE